MHRLFLLQQRPHHAKGGGGQDHQDHVDVQHRVGHKRSGHQSDVHPGAAAGHLAAQVKYHIQDHSRHACLHTFEQQRNVAVGGKGRVKDRDDG